MGNAGTGECITDAGRFEDESSLPLVRTPSSVWADEGGLCGVPCSSASSALPCEVLEPLACEPGGPRPGLAELTGLPVGITVAGEGAP